MKLSIMSSEPKDLASVTRGDIVDFFCYDDELSRVKVFSVKTQNTIRNAGRLIIQGTTSEIEEEAQVNHAHATCIIQLDAIVAPIGNLFFSVIPPAES